MSNTVESISRNAYDLPAERLIGDYSRIKCRPLDDPSAAVAAALLEPLDFPPLAACTVAGDVIVLAVDRGVPQVDAVVSGVVQTLLEAGASAEHIVVVCAAEMGEATRQRLLDALPPAARNRTTVQLHDPVDRERLTYVAASKSNRPIYVNRTICEADVVIPVGALRLEASLGYLGVHGSLFPTFADDETQRRFRAPSSTDWAALHLLRREEASEAAWLLGVQFTVQVIPGPGDSILHVLSGDANRVAVQGQRMCSSVWQHAAPQRASLVVATIEGGEDQQTWENVGRAVFAASQVVDEEGTIVICSELRQSPGPALQRLASSDSHDEILHELRRDRTPDAVTAALLLESRERCHILLLSGLDEETVEELGLGHVRDAGQVARLSHQHDSCILLTNAQQAMVRPVVEGVV